MTEIETFLVYELDDSGEKKQLNITQEELEAKLHPEQVLVIVREDLRRIFIWKGGKSPVRKRFISSRVAQVLQVELRKDVRYHRCKIVSVDAGDEPIEFLDAFQLESMEVTERLEDMRYVRNIDRDRGIVSKSAIIARDQKEAKEEYFSPALQDTGEKVIMSSITSEGLNPKAKIQYQKFPINLLSVGLSKEQQDKIKEKILKTEVPENLKRLNLILGHTLFAAISKSAKVFEEDLEETEWEPVKKLPKTMIELDNHILRVYFDDKNGIVEAIEVLAKKEKQTTEPAPKKKPATKKSAPKKKPATTKSTPKNESSMTPMPPKPASMKSKSPSKEEKNTPTKTTNRKQLPKIPSKED
ncbi:MAG: hypothetical protein ACFFB0_01455 [Promethearchaeota archaeon]